MQSSDLFLRFGVAIAIGFLVGLQREYAHGGNNREIIAGERTFSLIGLSGCLTAMLADEFGSPLLFAFLLLVYGGIVAVSYVIEFYRHNRAGLTTEVTVLVVVLIGALCYFGYLTLAVAAGIVTTVLLSLKLETDRFVQALTRADIMAALQLAVISAVILPVLPNQVLFEPPLDVLVPFKIWLMVVFISGVSFLGYVLMKIVGPSHGIGLTGLLGGLVSSTAVTLSFSERSMREKDLARPFGLAIMVASTIMFARVLVLVGVLNQALLVDLWLPLSITGLVGVGYSLYLFFTQRVDQQSEIAISNPFDLLSAVKFGAIYGLVLLVSRAAQLYFGNPGVVISSILSGLADVDAITLSMTELSSTGSLGLGTASDGILLAVLSNTVVKAGIATITGSRQLRRVLLPGYVLMILTGIVMAFVL
jgi:uncharacterized membrane protein (DUF4010 family)